MPTHGRRDDLGALPNLDDVGLGALVDPQGEADGSVLVQVTHVVEPPLRVGNGARNLAFSVDDRYRLEPAVGHEPLV